MIKNSPDLRALLVLSAREVGFLCLPWVVCFILQLLLYIKSTTTTTGTYYVVITNELPTTRYQLEYIPDGCQRQATGREYNTGGMHAFGLQPAAVFN